MRVWLQTLAIILILGAIGYTALQVSPWPAALFYRMIMNYGGETAMKGLERHLPIGVAVQHDEHYDLMDDDAYLDVFYPSDIAHTGRSLPTIVWIHGGAWLSGDKEHVANYLRILAGKGYTTIGVGYSLAPGHQYPTPLRQVNTALAYLVKHAATLHVNPSQFLIAGDSAGAQIAAQLATIITVRTYAETVGIVPAIDRSQLRGTILHCGPYDLGSVNFNGGFGHFLRTAMWAYSGSKDFLQLPHLAPFSVLHYVTADFPPTFISAGNGDPLLSQSRALADALFSRGVAVDSLFFPENYQPKLPHEYQFNLDNNAGQLALDRSLAFIQRVIASH
jgi:acetyl esterase